MHVRPYPVRPTLGVKKVRMTTARSHGRARLLLSSDGLLRQPGGFDGLLSIEVSRTVALRDAR